ncbi:AGAP005015-PA-like protein [Anopheles sinensis]|uniref:AGAP005015-PA-like protein n=1 Tax=Anopheles sinensis TaxID=74873 RepID=A0A084WDS3_ANOSI|nr:AGAP005015-PA-like protein [Anopheles sinensis]
METVTKVVKDVMKHLDRAGDNEYELRILIHLSLAGCVIGRGGSKIKEIKDVSTTRVSPPFALLPPLPALLSLRDSYYYPGTRWGDPRALERF